MDIREAALKLLENHDEEAQCIWVYPEPSCPVCTAGTVPDRLNRGLCAFHTLEALRREVVYVNKTA